MPRVKTARHPNPGGYGLTIGIDTNMNGKPTGRITWTMHYPQGGSFSTSDSKSNVRATIYSALHRNVARQTDEPLVVQMEKWDPFDGDWIFVRKWTTSTMNPVDNKGHPVKVAALSPLERALVRVANEHEAVREPLLDLLQHRQAVQSFYVDVKELPPSLQGALRKIHFGRKNVQVHPATQYTVASHPSFEGSRAFTMVVDLDSGATKMEIGSWGGPNMFTQKQVDLDDTPHPIPHNGAVVQGESGGYGTFAHIYVNPSNLAALLPSGGDEKLDPKEEKALGSINGIKPGYRADNFRRNGLGPYNAANPLIKSLIEKGMLVIKGPGIQVTTKGTNYAHQNRLRDY